ncbi:uncharacterized protein CXorf49 homolog isoform X2 [Cervus canadensis]|uniref:uncharacterized protein CXorf49 homolog isoform X2 n=1 Tax=Cervus canadensis TaxID=1574408 RepID=UPI001CA31CCA|nr:uncharacterized protein CXorf49 homolog isoform X2 [Cervus canadensis]
MRQPKQNTGKPPGASRTKDSDLCNRGKEPAPKSQLSCPSKHHGGYNIRDLDTKTSHIPGNSPLLPMAQGSVKPRASPPSSFQRPLCLPREEMKQPPTGAHNCLQCPVLQREIDNLKDQLVALQCFIDKFQSL